MTQPHVISRSRPHVRHLKDAQRRAASDTWRMRMKRGHQQSAVVVEAKSTGKVSARADQSCRRYVSEVSHTGVTRYGHFNVRIVKPVALANLKQTEQSLGVADQSRGSLIDRHWLCRI